MSAAPAPQGSTAAAEAPALPRAERADVAAVEEAPAIEEGRHAARAAGEGSFAVLELRRCVRAKRVHERAAQLEVELNDGRVCQHFQPFRKGDPELPLTDDEVNDKFLELAMPVIGDAPARALLADLWALEKRPSAVFEFGTPARARAAG